MMGSFFPDATQDEMGNYVIDLLVVYTAQARNAVGSEAKIESTIQAAVDSANLVFRNSRVSAVYRLVKTAEIEHEESGRTLSDLTWLRSNDPIGKLRDEAGADLVAMVVENGDSCGMSTGWGYGRTDYTFQVTQRQCLMLDYIFAHELGHNFGLEHDPANGPIPQSAAYPWSFGHYIDGVFRTVMAYPYQCKGGRCPVAPYFSNPDVRYLGYPTGVSNVSDNARTANLTVRTVSSYRRPPGKTPRAPADLSATAASDSEVLLSWIDQSDNEVGFLVERSVDGSRFTVIAALPENVQTYRSGGLSTSSQHLYRVRTCAQPVWRIGQ